jgi:hypothetical protein
MKLRFLDLELSLSQVRKVARAACDALPNGACVMTTDSDRDKCTLKNCSMMRVICRGMNELHVPPCRCVRSDGKTRFNINCVIHGKAP